MESPDLLSLDCDVAFPGTEDLFGHSVVDDTNWELGLGNDLDYCNLSALTLDRILLRAEARLKEQEELAVQYNLTSTKKKDHNLTTSNLPAPFMDSSTVVARPDSKMLVPNGMRRLADKPRVMSESLPMQRATSPT